MMMNQSHTQSVSYILETRAQKYGTTDTNIFQDQNSGEHIISNVCTAENVSDVMARVYGK